VSTFVLLGSVNSDAAVVVVLVIVMCACFGYSVYRDRPIMHISGPINRRKDDEEIAKAENDIIRTYAFGTEKGEGWVMYKGKPCSAAVSFYDINQLIRTGKKAEAIAICQADRDAQPKMPGRFAIMVEFIKSFLPKSMRGAR